MSFPREEQPHQALGLGVKCQCGDAALTFPQAVNLIL